MNQLLSEWDLLLWQYTSYFIYNFLMERWIKIIFCSIKLLFCFKSKWFSVAIHICLIYSLNWVIIYNGVMS